MHNGDKHVHIDNSGRNILGHSTHSSIGKCIVDDMAFGVVGQPGCKSGLRRTRSLLRGEINWSNVYNHSLCLDQWRLDSRLWNSYWTTWSLVGRQLVAWNVGNNLANISPTIALIFVASFQHKDLIAHQVRYMLGLLSGNDRYIYSEGLKPFWNVGDWMLLRFRSHCLFKT